ncbi:hypothetical protein HMPREF0063_12487 [Aeromicrobium marinum DSM 15272]|uniref:Uncharacterized protein n=1 Tax=Aeromicrobium marinum DSM 15272 TaxID=585531 RepID=E2SEM8_9ACTN|nr:hypothetical protein [Aeromicrobium marinum]EFQ82325.1 hypothetical protein HMPREF0063_12487 [Aeromicrobium marinum DSM 15272]
MSKRPWFVRPLTWVVIVVLTVVAQNLVDERTGLRPLFHVALTVLVVAVVAQAFRWGTRFIRGLALVSGAVTLGGAIYLARLPDDHNGIGDMAVIVLSWFLLAVAAWNSQPESSPRPQDV